MALKSKSVPQVRRLKDFSVAQRVLFSEAVPYLAMVWAPAPPTPMDSVGPDFSVATYNVHRWAGVAGRNSASRYSRPYCASQPSRQPVAAASRPMTSNCGR